MLRLLVATMVLVLCSFPNAMLAQSDVLPGGKRPELVPLPEAAPEPRLELPPPPEPRAPRTGVGEARVFVRNFQIEGSTVFSAAELGAVTAPFEGRAIATAELLAARDAVTTLYQDAGYLTSGAVLPDQDSDDGSVRLQVIEGSLEEIAVHGVRRFRKGYFRTRLTRAGRAPVNVATLEDQLQQLQRDPKIERVAAQLLPGSQRGRSRLELGVEEHRFYGATLEFSNGNSPSIGSLTGRVRPRLANLLGYGDVWSGEFELSEGLRDFEAEFSIPIPPFDTRFSARFQQAESEVVEEPFDALEIESESQTIGLTLTQPVLRQRLAENGLQQVELGITGEYRRSETDILGRCFSFVLGSPSCTSRVSVLRLFGEWIRTTPTRALALRSTLSIGIDAFGSTQRGAAADSEYLAWLVQLQVAQRLPRWLAEAELLARIDSQLAGEPLLGIEKFSVGGVRTVRGYRENELVRDSGYVGSLEVRIPLWHDARGQPVVQLAPFVDHGRSWDEDARSDAESITSVGVGLRVMPMPWLRGELYWGHAFDDFEELNDDLQNDGLHFSITVTPF